MNVSVPWPLATLSDIPSLFWLAPVAGVAALLMARLFSASVMKRSEGDEEMVRIAQAVREGAIAYLFRQYKVVSVVFVALVVFLALLWVLGLQPGLTMIGVPIAGLLSGLTGWFGMKMATNASARTAFAAKQSLNDGLVVAFRSGAVMGLNVVGFALLDISFWFFVLNSYGEFFGLSGGPAERIAEMTTIMLSFGMGASTQALFARVGGGIYTKAADVGADLVGKVEAGIPEDDARNPATIADNVGDNVGDVAGMGADLYESYYGSILATLALGAAAAISVLGLTTGAASFALQLAAAPIALAGLGILCSIVGIFAVRTSENATFAQLLKSLHTGVYVASALIAVGALGVLYYLFGSGASAEALAAAGTVWWKLGVSIVFGLAAGLVIAYATEYYTSYERPPTQSIAHQALTGPATVIIAGVAEGMKSTWASLLTTAVAILGAFLFAGGADSFLMGLYGVGIAAVGMLSTLGITLATDAYGPIADNAGGNAEMSGQPPEVRKRTDMLDSLGNTTAATGKGFAIGSAALTALALFAAYVQIVQTQITTQAVNYGKAHAAEQATPVAVHQGYGKFAVAFPKAMADGTDYYDGALFLPSHDLPRKTIRHIPVGAQLPVTAVGTDPFNANRYTVTWAEQNARFDVISSRQATIDEIMHYYDVTLTNPRVIAGLFIGVLLTFLFCALTMNAVGRAAYRMMRECRRQFGKMREAFRAAGMTEDKIADPESWPKRVTHEGVQYPDYANCVSISTAGAQKEMIVPSILAITAPIALGLVLGVGGVLGMLAGGLVSGFAVAVFMANAGGAWDNAKKLLESYGRITAESVKNDAAVREKIPAEVREGIVARAEDEMAAGRPKTIVYGKGSPDHKATVVGDTVGDPFKDTSGPSLNILIKLISIVSVVFAGLIVRFAPAISHALGLE
ncbi:MAG: sodium/proton-translocating pyrophosphatase [Opitutaceae bacterium]|nr:sodium/proton-translocating pyrophosphatase [Opitutaceae bacterium]